MEPSDVKKLTDLAALREAIDSVDQRLLGLLAERAALAQQVGHVKATDDAPVYRPEREAAVIARLVDANHGNGGSLPAASIEAIWREVMSACRALERRPRVGFLGPRGTYTEQALRKHFGAGVDALDCQTLDEVFRATEAGQCDFGIVPVENSTEGAVNRTLDLLQQSPLLVCGEITVPIHHVLMSRSGSIDGVERICAHPQSFAQCVNWLARNHPRIEKVPVSSNAEGARLAAADPRVGAIAGEMALSLYDLKPVANGIQDDPLNRTRFLVIGKYRCGPSGKDQTSLILAVPDKAGAVHTLIEPLARHGVSMKRFESRPARQGGWEYYFHIDLIGHEADPPLAAALGELEAHAAFCKSLGSYPTEGTPPRGTLGGSAGTGCASTPRSAGRPSPTQGAAAVQALVADASPVYVKGIAPYQGGRPIEEIARQYGIDPRRIVKLASNENPLGMPASARDAIAKAMEQIGRYPDGNAFDLKQALATRHRLPPDWFTLGNGSNDILELAARALCAAGESIVYSQYSFAVYALATQSVGAKAIVVPAREFGHDLDAMAGAVRADTRLVFVANPNNPTGTFLSGDALERFIESIPANVAIVLDEAYTEYLAPELRYDAFRWVRRFPNLIVSRTFSKAFGLAGLRVGFAVAQPAITDLLNRIRQPFNVNSLAQAAAIAALGDEAFLDKSRTLNREGVAQLQQGFERLGLRFLPSFGNFVLVEVGDAAAVNEAMLRAGVIVRPVANYGMPTWLRISVGLAQENEAALKALEAALGRANRDTGPSGHA